MKLRITAFILALCMLVSGITVTATEEAVCYIGDDAENTFTSLKTALYAADGEVVHLLCDTTLEASDNFGTTGGYIIDGSGEGGNNYTITLTGNVAIVNEPSGTLTNVNIDMAGYRFDIKGTTEFNFGSGTAIENGGGSDGGTAIVRSGATLNIKEGCIIRNSTASANGGALHVRGTVVMSGGSIEDCKSANRGGAVALYEDGIMKISGNATITGNISTAKGETNVEVRDADSLILADDFTGTIGITFDNATEGTAFGIAEDGATGAENFIFDEDGEITGAVKNGNLVLYRKSDAVCYIGDDEESGTVYSSLKEAMTEAEGETIHLIADTAFPSGNITTKGFVIDGSNGDGNYTITYEGDVTFLNEAGAIFENVNIDLNEKHNNVTVNGSGTKSSVTLGYGAEVYGGYGTNGGAFLINKNAEVIMKSGAKVTGCYAKNNGGAFFINEGTLKMEGGTIEGCKAQVGSGVFAGGIAYLYVSGDAYVSGNDLADASGNVTKEDSHNVELRSTNTLNLASELTGSIKVYFRSNELTVKEGAVFGTAKDNATGAENIISENDDTLSGVILGGKLAFQSEDFCCYIEDEDGNIISASQSLGTAIKAANGNTVRLLSDAELSPTNDGINIRGVQSAVIDGSDGKGGFYTITLTDDIRFVNPGTVTFKNVKLEMDGHHFDTTVSDGSCVIVFDENTAVTGGKAANGGAVLVNAGCELIMKNGSGIENCEASGGGGAVCVNGGTFTMMGGKITGNKANNGGGVSVSDTGKVKVSGDAVINSNTKSDGETADNVKLSRYDSFYLVGELSGEIGITITEAGPGMQFGVAEDEADGADNIFMDSDKTQLGSIKSGKLVFPITGEAYIGESAEEGMIYGTLTDAIKASNGEVVHLLSDASLTGGNLITGEGYIIDGSKADGGTFKITLSDNVTILNEKSAELRNVEVDLNQKHFLISVTGSNKSKLILGSGAVLKNGFGANGGAAIINAGGEVVVEDGALITECRASSGGGAFHVNGGTLTLTGGKITGNHADSNGGGVIVAQTGTVNLSGNAEIMGNTKGSDNKINNLRLSDNDSLNLNADFTGNVGITLDNTTSGDAFGKGGAGVSGAEKLWSDLDSSLHGFLSGDSLLWLSGTVVIDITTDGGVYKNEDGSIKSGVLRIITGFEKAENTDITAYGTYIIPSDIFDRYEYDLYNDTENTLIGYRSILTSKDNMFKAPGEISSFGVDMVNIPGDKIDAEFIPVTFFKSGDKYYFVKHDALSVSDIKEAGEIKVIGSLTETFMLPEIKYLASDSIYIEDSDLAKTLFAEKVYSSSSLSEYKSGEEITTLQDLKSEPEFVPDKKYVIYEFSEITKISGLRLMESRGVIAENALIYVTDDGETWKKVGNLRARGCGTLTTDFGYNVNVKAVAIEFPEDRLADIALADMHILKGERSYKDISIENIESFRFYSNLAGGFTAVADTQQESAKIEKLFDGDYNTYWHSGYVSVDGTTRPLIELPHTITVTFEEERVISGMRYIPRNGSNKISTVSVYGTVNGKNYYLLAESERWSYASSEDQEPRMLDFGENYSVKEVKIVITAASNNVHSTGAEIEFLKGNMGYETHNNLSEDGLVNRINAEITATDGEISYAFDGVEKSFWEAEGDASLTVNFEKIHSLSGIKYLSGNGKCIEEADIYISEDGENFINFAKAAFNDENEYHFYANIKVKAIKIDITKSSSDKITVAEMLFLSGNRDYTDILLSNEMESPASWEISASEYEGNPAVNLIDGDINSEWRTYYSDTEEDKTPTDIIIDFGEDTEFSGISYYPRRSGGNGYFTAVDFYISVEEDENGNPVWDYIGSDSYSYVSGREVKTTVFSRNYKAGKLKICVKEGKNLYAAGAEIKLLKADASKVVKSAHLLSGKLYFDPAEPYEVLANFEFNESGRVVSIKYNGMVIPKSFYSVTEEGIILSTYVFDDFVDLDENTAEFTVDFLQGENARVVVEIGAGETFRVDFEAESEKGSLSVTAINSLGVSRSVSPGAEIKQTERIKVEAISKEGYGVGEWVISNTTPVYEKIEDRSGWKVDASTYTNEIGLLNMTDGKDTTYWHSGYSIVDGSPRPVEDKDKKPYYITLDFGESIDIAGLSFLCRQDSSEGKITAYEIYESSDGISFDTLICKGSVSYENRADRSEKDIHFGKTVNLKTLQIKITETSGTWGQIAEIWALKEKAPVEGRVIYKGTVSEKYEIDSVSTDIKVEAVFNELSGEATVNYNLSNISTEEIKKVDKGAPFKITLKCEGKYKVPENVTVKSEDTVLMAGTDYTYERISDTEASLTVRNVNGKISITASGIMENAHRISFTDDFGASGELPADIYEIEGGKVKLITPKLSLAGYKFAGWKVYYDGISEEEAKVYKAGAMFTMINKDVNFDTVWEALKDKEPGKKPSGGGGSSGGTIIVPDNSKTVIVNVEGIGEIKLSKGDLIPAAAEKEGYTFIGYYLDAAYTVPYSNSGVSESITLYPFYRKIRHASELTDMEGHWAEDAVGEMYENYLVNGKAEGIFAPDDKITRAEFCQILYLLSAKVSDGAEPFADVNVGDWFMPAVSWAYNNKIVMGISEDAFAPYDAITREDMAVMLYRFATYMGAQWQVEKEADFIDSNEISDYALYQVRWAKDKGIILGYPDGSFKPSGYACRAEAAVMIKRAADFVK